MRHSFALGCQAAARPCQTAAPQLPSARPSSPAARLPAWLTSALRCRRRTQEVHDGPPLLPPGPLLQRVGVLPRPPSLVPKEPETFGPPPSSMLSPEERVASQRYPASRREREASRWATPCLQGRDSLHACSC